MKPRIEISESTKLADLIHSDIKLLQVIDRFGIPLGFRDSTISQICERYKINKEFFLEIIKSVYYTDYFPDTQLQSFSVNLIIDYLQKSHNYYMDIKIPEIEEHLHSFISSGVNGDVKFLDILESFFYGYIEEVKAHLAREENSIYPYAIEIEEAVVSGKVSENLAVKLREFPISEYEEQHDNTEDKLYDLKNIIIKYLPSPKDKSLCHHLLTELFKLENDMSNHARIEDNVLIPKVKHLEEKVLEMIGNSSNA